MKILVTTLIIASATGAAMAQGTAAQAPTEAAKVYAESAKVFGETTKAYQAAKVVAELSAAQGHGLQKNSPLSAEEVNESVQTLADGNRIVRNSTGKFYRNSEGRIRREGSGGVSGVLGTTYSYGQGVSIVNPVGGQKYVLDSELKTARVIEMAQGGQKGISIAGSALAPAAVGGHDVVEARKLHELATRATDARTIAPLNIQTVPGMATTITTGTNGVFLSNVASTKYETRNEDLGTRDFEGVSAEGTRRTTIIPAGAIGNERPIETVYERWYSKDLGMVVYSKNTDPRFGEQIYRLTNIIRSEPDPSLFAVPTEYRKFSENGTLYKVSSTSPSPKTPAPPKPIMVSKPGAKAARP